MLTVGLTARAGVVAALGFVACATHTEAASLSRISCKGQPNGAKSISPEITATPGDGQLPFAVVAVLSAQLRISDPVAGGLRVLKSELTPQEAYGAGLPNGYTGGGPLNPDGPWLGLQWPFRDFADGYVPRPVGGPRGNDIGNIVQSSPTEVLVRDIFGEMAFNPDIPSTYTRGFPGNGATDYARYFAIDLFSTVPQERNVTVMLENVMVAVLVREEGTGRVFVQTQSAADVSLEVHVPTPASGVLLLGLVPLAGRRRRC